MPKIDKDTFIASDVPLSSVHVKQPGRAARMATPLDLLFVLAAFLAFSFGWRLVLGMPTVSIVVGVGLFWLGIEKVAHRVGLRVRMSGWISLTRVDVAILLVALLLSTWKELLLLVVIPVWLIVAALALLRLWRINADGWFHWAALLISFMAIEVGAEAARIWLSAGENGGPPSPLTHIGFHESIDGGIAVSCILLLLLLAWWPVRQREAWGVAVLVSATLPTALIWGGTAVVVVLKQRPYGYEHAYTWLLVVFWLLGVLSAVWGLVRERHTASSKALSARELVVTVSISFAAPFCIIIVGALDILFLPLVIGWMIAAIVVWLRGTHVGAAGWYHRTIILTAFLAAEVSAEVSKIWLYGGCGGRWDCSEVPGPLNAIGFHHLLDFGIGVGGVLLVLLLAWIPALLLTGSSEAPFAWQPLHRSHFWRLSAVLAATLPTAMLGGWAAYVALSQQRWYGYEHPFAWLLAIFWVLTALSMGVAWILLQRTPPVGAIPEEAQDRT